MDLTQSGSHVSVSFSAGRADGSGAAPDGGGDGQVDQSNVVHFTFKDSFDNEGTGTVSRKGDVYSIDLEVSQELDSRAAQLYGTFALKRTSKKPASP